MKEAFSDQLSAISRNKETLLSNSKVSTAL